MCILGHAGGCRAAAVQCRAARGMHGCYDFLLKPENFPLYYLLYLDLKWVTKGMLQSHTWNSKNMQHRRKSTGAQQGHVTLFEDQLSNTSHTPKNPPQEPLHTSTSEPKHFTGFTVKVCTKCVPAMVLYGRFSSTWTEWRRKNAAQNNNLFFNTSPPSATQGMILVKP